jgi:chromate transporter
MRARHSKIGMVARWLFPKLGTIGFGEAALVGFSTRTLSSNGAGSLRILQVIPRAAQIMPGPLAAQTAIAIGYFDGVLGATLVGLGFIVPSFLMVIAISLAYVSYGGLWWMQALFYTIGATVIAIIAMLRTNWRAAPAQSAPLGIFVCLTIVTVWAQTELASSSSCGLIVLVFQAAGWKPGILMVLSCVVLGIAVGLMEAWLGQAVQVIVATY